MGYYGASGLLGCGQRATTDDRDVTASRAALLMPTFAGPDSPPQVLMPLSGITARGPLRGCLAAGCSARPPADHDDTPAAGSYLT